MRERGRDEGRLRLLQVLAEAKGPLSAKELNRMAFDGLPNEESVRHHLRQLRDGLARAFPDFESELFPGNGGYQLALK